MIIISAENFINDVMHTVDLVMNGFVQAGFEHLIQNNQAVITEAMTFYVAWLGYKILSHKLEMDINQLASHLGLLIIVYALMTDWQLYDRFFYDIFTNEPGEICKTLIDANANVHVQNVIDALNTAFAEGIVAAKTLFHLGNIRHAGMWMLAVLVFISTLCECLVALAILVYAKVAVGFTLLLGPLFILLLLWGPTREFFNKWVQQLVNYALIPIITCAILMLAISLANATLPGLTQSVQSGIPTFTKVSVYVGISFVCLLLYLQILPMCAALSGGVALGGLSLARQLAQQLIQKSGIAVAQGKAGHLMNRGTALAKNSFSSGMQKLAMARAKAARTRKFGVGS